MAQRRASHGLGLPHRATHRESSSGVDRSTLRGGRGRCNIRGTVAKADGVQSDAEVSALNVRLPKSHLIPSVAHATSMASHVPGATPGFSAVMVTPVWLRRVWIWRRYSREWKRDFVTS